MQTKIPEWTLRQVVLATINVVAVILAFWLLYRFWNVLFLLFSGIVVATAIRPLVEWLNRRGLSRTLGVVLVYLLLAGLLVGFGLLVAPVIANQVTQISSQVPTYYLNLRNSMIASNNQLVQGVGFSIPLTLNTLLHSAPVQDQPLDQVAQTFHYASLVTQGLFAGLAIFLLGFYWTQEYERTIRAVLFVFPASQREVIRETLVSAEAKVGAYIRGEIILTLTVGAAAYIAYLIIGLPYALVLAIIAGVMEAVPVFGPILGAIPAIMIALTFGPDKAIWVLVSTTLIQTSENHLLVPIVMNRSVGVNPIVTLLALAAFGSLLGLPGAILAIPMAAIIQLLIDRYFLSFGSIRGNIVGRDYLSLLRYEARDLARDVQKQLRQKANFSDQTSDRIEDEIESIAYDLDALLEKLSEEEEIS